MVSLFLNIFCELFVSENSHLIFSDCGWPQVVEITESKTINKRGSYISLEPRNLLYLGCQIWVCLAGVLITRKFKEGYDEKDSEAMASVSEAKDILIAILTCHGLGMERSLKWRNQLKICLSCPFSDLTFST